MIHLKGIHNLVVKSEVRNHSIISDTSVENGGSDEAMNPHEILESALAACTAITLKMYARRKQMPLDDVLVEVHTVSEGKESVLSRKVTLMGALSIEDQKRLLEIADKCPIHKLLTSQISIQTVSV
jgi:putative redox protein